MSTDNNNNNSFEDVCFLCRRTESKAGKMIHLQANMAVCADCMQKTLNSMSMFTPNGFGMFGKPFSSSSNNKEENSSTNTGNESNSDNLDNVASKANDTSTDDNNDNNNENNNSGFFGGNDLFGSLFGGFGPMDSIPGMPSRNKVKKSSKKKKNEPVMDEKDIFDIKNIPAPHIIKGRLDEYVVGQDRAKKIISVGVYNHYKRVAAMMREDDVEIEKSNMLMLGPTGCGKTYIVKTLAKLLNVPLAITDATSLTEAGYIGDDIESVVSKLLAAADNDVDRAEHGIIFIDEIDKIAKKRTTNSRDVSGESVQQGMLKLLEGADVEVPVGATNKNAMVPMATVNTSNILFICGGAFPDLERIVKERLTRTSSMGFKAELKDKYDNDDDILSKVQVEDLREFGMIPEFLGRLPIVFSLGGLTEDMMVKILTEPKNAILRQYKKLLEMDEVLLEFNESALKEIAKKAMEKKTGARALRSTLEEFMTDIMYEIPKDDNIGKVTITKEYIEGSGIPIIEMRQGIKHQELN